MSRIVLRDDDQFEVVVGYDGPLQTFFAQVYDRAEFERRLKADPDADEVLVLWEGTSPGAIQNVRIVREMVKPWAVLDSAVEERLLADQKSAAPPTPLQQEMRRRMT